jgi:hypothetical protein
MARQRTLTPLIGVRIPVPQPLLFYISLFQCVNLPENFIDSPTRSSVHNFSRIDQTGKKFFVSITGKLSLHYIEDM